MPQPTTQDRASAAFDAAVFPALDPSAYERHPLHSADRIWPETNCFMDLWIEVLASLGHAPEAMLGFTVTQDFEGDQATFFKVPAADLEAIYGLRLQELAIFEHVEDHVTTQIARGRLCLVEVDGFYLPDTQGVAYHTEHGKTTVAINRLDITGRRMEYFHNAGYFTLEGEDFDGVFQRTPGADGERPLFLPYTEFVKFGPAPEDGNMKADACKRLASALAQRPAENPIAAFAAVFPAQAENLAGRPFAAFHHYAFNTLRQFGSNFELLASHLDWLGEDGADARAIAETMKSAQFQLARAVNRGKFEKLTGVLDPAVAAWDRLMADLETRFKA
ncbi:hypothetical protein HDIA_3925 [Hartmannibacter diazotrophicus]|uniref:Serine--tRNA ligase n=1 Tax=Hartmannibacter diazotrophicus TaxID=1482074 RepID=A0A2C9DB31_9HYPH|nr:DUF1839 family protein [Hartmannibacter diazotrophicus]SON57466.1 hypothetical protein HDIA_3925 [Hartmannibacter diazotrophicus]